MYQPGTSPACLISKVVMDESSGIFAKAFRILLIRTFAPNLAELQFTGEARRLAVADATVGGARPLLGNSAVKGLERTDRGKRSDQMETYSTGAMNTIM